MKIKKGDVVKVTAGKDKGREGKVERAWIDKILVPGVNQYKKHVKPQGAIKRSESAGNAKTNYEFKTNLPRDCGTQTDGGVRDHQ